MAITFQKVGSRDLSGIVNSARSKGISAIPPLFNGQEYLFTCFPSKTNLKLHNIYATPKMVKKVLNEP